MNTHRTPTSIKLSLTALALTASSLAVFTSSTPSSAATRPTTSISAAAAIVTCDGVGKLTGTGGHLVSASPPGTTGTAGRTCCSRSSPDQVRLTDDHGTHYRLVGGGYDSVVYPGSDVTGQVSAEDEAFTFDVTGPDGVVGVVRFRLDIRHGHSPQVHDASTCKLPHLT